MARQAKETAGNKVMTAARFVPIGGVESEEAEEAEEAERVDSSRAALEARLEKAMAEPDYEREETFRYLKEYRKQKRLDERLERQDEAREKMRAAVDRILREDAERSARETEGMSWEAMVESAGVGIAYFEDENGKLVKRRASAKRKTAARRRTPADGISDDIYLQNENGELVPYVPPPPRVHTGRS